MNILIIFFQIVIAYIDAFKITISKRTKISKKLMQANKMNVILIEWGCIGNKTIIISQQIMN